MNERIRELMKECGIPVKHTRIDGNGYEYYTPNYEVEKFAELIVRECAYIARQCYTVRAVEAEDVAKHIEETFRS